MAQPAGEHHGRARDEEDVEGGLGGSVGVEGGVEKEEFLNGGDAGGGCGLMGEGHVMLVAPPPVVVGLGKGGVARFTAIQEESKQYCLSKEKCHITCK